MVLLHVVGKGRVHKPDQPNGAAPATRLGCAGWTARMIARISYAAGRSAWVARRAAAILPGPMRPITLGVIALLSRVTAQLLFTPLLWAVCGLLAAGPVTLAVTGEGSVRGPVRSGRATVTVALSRLGRIEVEAGRTELRLAGDLVRTEA